MRAAKGAVAALQATGEGLVLGGGFWHKRFVFIYLSTFLAGY